MNDRKILVVEDEGIIAVDTKLSLVALGYDVLPIAISGESAVELALQYHPDLILMDVKLGGKMDGIEAARAIQEKLRTLILFMTAHTDNETLSKAKALNPIGIISKPVMAYQLKEFLASALKAGS